MSLNVMSLFSGAGGMDVGVVNAGFRVVVASELDPHACNTYKENHPHTTMIEGDIDCCMDKLASFKEIDLLIGGPPCQGFSVAGKMDLEDPRSKLVFSFCEVVERIKPKAFIMENVKSLASLTKFEIIREEFFRRIEAAGYQLSISILNAKDYGVPQARERAFFIGMSQEYAPVTIHSFEKYKQPADSLRKAIAYLGPAGSKTNPNVTKAKITLAVKPVLRKSPYAGMLFNGQGRPLNPDGWSSTLPASMGGNRTPIIDEEHLYHDKPSWVEEYHQKLISGASFEYSEAPARLRRLTIDEAAILQTFPSNYKFSGPQTKIFSQIGNAVPCKLAEVVAKAVKSSLLKETSVKSQRVEMNQNLVLAF